MMRKAQTPHEGCGLSRGGSWRRVAAGFACALSCALLIVTMTVLTADAALAQTARATGDPFAPSSKKKQSSFPKGSVFGKVDTKIDRSQPMRLQGDQLIYDKAGNRVIARGNVEIYYNNYILTADEVVYDQGAGTLTAVGNVTVKEPQGNIVHADRYTLTDDFRDGFVQSLSIVTQDQSRITADRAIRRNGNVNEFENGKFTPCKSDGGTPPLWCISATRIIHDADAATITYQDAFFEIFGQPVFYLPYFQTPDPSVKRKSGFLSPIYGNSSTLGYITGIPYYYALAPNADITVTPEYMSQQGLFFQGEWRHRLSNGEYTIKVAGIDQDANDLPDTVNDRDKFGGLRGSVESKGLFSLSSWWKFGWDGIIESDDQFRRFYKLDSVLVVDRVNQVYLTGQSDRNYFSAKLYQFGGLLTNDTPQTESSTHPIIDYNYVFADPVLGGELKWNTNVLSFTQNDAASDKSNHWTNSQLEHQSHCDRVELAAEIYRRHRHQLHAVRRCARRSLPVRQLHQSGIRRGGSHNWNRRFVVLRRIGYAGPRHRRRRCHSFVSLGGQHRERQPYHRTYRSDRGPPGEYTATAVSGPRRAEPRIRRHELVQYVEVFGL